MSTEKVCAICGSGADLTVEHIIPQTLLKAWGRDPNDAETEFLRTWLCRTHQARMGKIHDRPEMMRLIVDGEPATEKALRHFGDWAVWVTMLRGVARGKGVWPVDAARNHLLNQFTDKASGGATPKGTRVYAARFNPESVEQNEVADRTHAVMLHDDDRIELDAQGVPSGFSSKAGIITAAECLLVGKLAVLVLGPTWNSGPGHRDRLDAVPEVVGFTRIHPFRSSIPALRKLTVDPRSAEKLFTVEPLMAADFSLLPMRLRILIAMFRDEGVA